MVELARRFESTSPDVVIVLTPHNVHVSGALAVVVAGCAAGDLEGAAEPVALTCDVDRDLAAGILREFARRAVPAVGISFGGNDPEAAVMPLDWGSLIPLWYLGGRRDPPVPAVIVAPARDLSWPLHVTAGGAIADVVRAAGKRVALVASADHSHVHSADGPYGDHPAAAVFDARVLEALRSDDLGRLLELPPQLIEDAKPDSLWQLLMLHGALGDGWHAELLSYEAPTYYGMLCAAYAPRAAEAGR